MNTTPNVGDTVRTAEIDPWSTTTTRVREETVTRVTITRIITDHGVYKRRTGRALGDHALGYPREIIRVVKADA